MIISNIGATKEILRKKHLFALCQLWLRLKYSSKVYVQKDLGRVSVDSVNRVPVRRQIIDADTDY